MLVSRVKVKPGSVVEEETVVSVVFVVNVVVLVVKVVVSPAQRQIKLCRHQDMVYNTSHSPHVFLLQTHPTWALQPLLFQPASFDLLFCISAQNSRPSLGSPSNHFLISKGLPSLHFQVPV